MRWGLRQGWCSALAAFGFVLSLAAAPLHAQTRSAAQPKPAPSSLTGTWRAGATAMDVAVESWGTDCGPRPQSSRSGGGGVVTVTQAGKLLVIRSKDTEVRSDACWSQNPSMRPTSSSVVDQVWITRCKTPQNDPREELGTYTLKVVGPDTLLYQDVSHYNWALKSSKCVATFTTTQTLVRGAADASAAAKSQAPVPAAATVPEAAVPSVPPAPERACTPGAPTQLTLRPKRAEVPVGGRVCLRARLADANDCALPGVTVEWSIEHSKAVRAELHDGCFTAASTSAEAEGDFRVVARSLGLQADAVVKVRAPDLSGLTAQRSERVELAALDGPGGTTTTSTAAARIRAGTVKERRWSLGMWLGVGAIVVLAAAAAAFVMRRKPSVAPPDDNDGRADDRASIPGSHRPRPEAQHAPRVTTPEAPPKPSVRTAPEAPAASAEPWICPLCRVGYPATQGTCSRDGSELMPYSEFNKRTRETAQAKQKRCPKCGAMSPAGAVFCGDDGTTLVDA